MRHHGYGDANYDFAVGQSVAWFASGKVARIEGCSGKRVTGTVVSINGTELTIAPDHRKSNEALFPGLESFVGITQVIQ